MFKWCRSSRWKATDAFTARLYKQSQLMHTDPIQISNVNIYLLKHKQPSKLYIYWHKTLG